MFWYAESDYFVSISYVQCEIIVRLILITESKTSARCLSLSEPLCVLASEHRKQSMAVFISTSFL